MFIVLLTQNLFAACHQEYSQRQMTDQINLKKEIQPYCNTFTQAPKCLQQL